MTRQGAVSQGTPGAKKKVLVLTTTLPAKPGDGTPEFVLTLAKALAEHYDITVLAPRGRGGAKEESVEGLKIIRFAYFFRPLEGLADGAILPNLKSQPWRLVEVPFLVLGLLVKTLGFVRRERPQVINAHWIVPAGWVALVAHRLYKVPYVLTVHGADAHALNGALMSRLKRRVVAGARTVTPVSSEIGELLVSGPGDPHLPVVPMGVDVPAIRAEVGARAPERGRFLFVGRLAEKKGVDVLLGALKEVVEARAVILGGGPDEGSLKALAAKLALGERVAFLGQQPRARVMQELRVAQALVIPSKVAADGDREGTPVVMAEAVAAGVPIVASDLAGLGENLISGETGLLVAPGSVTELAGALSGIVDGKHALESWAAAATERLGPRLSVASTAERYREFFDAAIAGHQ